MADQESEQLDETSLAELTTNIVTAYVRHHTVAATDLAKLITTVGEELGRVGRDEVAPDRPEPAVAVNRSVRTDKIFCLICGQPQKLLKRHLATRHDLTPEDYRTMFDLKSSYPMVAADYAARRSDMAKKIGLGRNSSPEPKKKPAKKTGGKRQTKAS
jgi:predicted transcriptional regulator